jgi:hypothetical protein
MEDMTKFSCTMSLGEDLYYATLIAEDEQQAREMAVAEASKKWAKAAGRPRNWNVAVLESGVSGPAQILDCGHRDM